MAETSDVERARQRGARIPATVGAFVAEVDAGNEHLRCGKSTQYPRSVRRLAKREYRNDTYHTQ